jgi:hypothetical protein
MMDTGDRFQILQPYDGAGRTGRIELAPDTPDGEYKVSMDGVSGYEWYTPWAIEQVKADHPVVYSIDDDQDGYDRTYLLAVDGRECEVSICQRVRTDHAQPLVHTSPGAACSAEVIVYGERGRHLHVLVLCCDLSLDEACHAVRTAMDTWPEGKVEANLTLLDVSAGAF